MGSRSGLGQGLNKRFEVIFFLDVFEDREGIFRQGFTTRTHQLPNIGVVFDDLACTKGRTGPNGGNGSRCLSVLFFFLTEL